MASAQSISIDVEPRINQRTAKLSLAILELFMNQNPELEVIGERLPDGTIQLKFQELQIKFKERKEPKPFDKVKRHEEMTPELRNELGL